MKTFYITARRARRKHERLELKGNAETIRFDWSSWAEDNGVTLTGVTWSVESGNAAVSSTSLASNVATGTITVSETGRSLIKLTATDGTLIDVQYLEIKGWEPNRYVDDYGMCA